MARRGGLTVCANERAADSVWQGAELSCVATERTALSGGFRGVRFSECVTSERLLRVCRLGADASQPSLATPSPNHASPQSGGCGKRRVWERRPERGRARKQPRRSSTKAASVSASGKHPSPTSLPPTLLPPCLVLPQASAAQGLMQQDSAARYLSPHATVS